MILNFQSLLGSRGVFCHRICLICFDSDDSVWSPGHYMAVPDGTQTLSKNGAKNRAQNPGTHWSRWGIQIAGPREIKSEGEIGGILIKSPAFLALPLIPILSCVRRSVCCCITFCLWFAGQKLHHCLHGSLCFWESAQYGPVLQKILVRKTGGAPLVP